MTFEELKFSALRREGRIQKEDGTLSDEIKERTYERTGMIDSGKRSVKSILLIYSRWFSINKTF